MSDTVVDIFADRATPGARQTRPALFRARLAWSAIKLNSPPAPPRTVCGVTVGDRVEVEVTPGQRRRGVVTGWERAGETGTAVVHGATVARIRLDMQPGDAFAVVKRRRDRIFPLTKEA